MDYSDTTKTHREVWAERADEVELLAHEYVKGWVASVGKTQGLYLHILLRHIPEEIRKWGDLRVRSSQGLEHCHKNRKRIDGKECKGAQCVTTDDPQPILGTRYECQSCRHRPDMCEVCMKCHDPTHILTMYRTALPEVFSTPTFFKFV